MSSIQQLANTFLHRKEKAARRTNELSCDEGSEFETEDEEMKKIGNALLQRPPTPLLTPVPHPCADTNQENGAKKKRRFSRWDRQRRFRSQKINQDADTDEKSSKRRSRSLISMFFGEAANVFAVSTPRQPCKPSPELEMHQSKSFQKKNVDTQSATSSAIAPTTFAVQPPQQSQSAGQGGKSLRNSSTNIQSTVAKFGGKASAFVPPMPSKSNDTRIASVNAQKPNPIQKAPVGAIKSLMDSKNLLNKKEGAGIIKESTESSQTIEEQDGEVKTTSGGTNLKHENTVVHVDTANMASAAVATTSSVTSPSPLATPTTPGLPPSARKQEIIKLTEHLIDAISTCDYATYSKFCDSAMTCFEPESLGNLIEGLEFHKFYFDNSSTGVNANSSKQIRSTMLNPHVHLLGDDAACIAYVRLIQWVDKNGIASTKRCEETRIWQKRDGKWHCIHYHRSASSSSFFLS